jgi:hypothetical protein
MWFGVKFHVMNIEKLIKVIIIDCDTKGMNNDEWDIIP